MAYTPQNLQIFTAAFCGALAGMGLSDRQITSQSPATYAGLASVAGAFAQAVDTAWTSARATTLLDVEAVQSESAAYWQERSPIPDSTNTSAATHASGALAMIATITAGEAYFSAQGITPPAIPGGTSGGFPNVPNLAALGAIDWSANALANGYQYYVQTQRSFWILSQNGTETVNGNTVIAAAGGGRWIRDLSFAHPSWLNVNDWYIDATNGNDENNGQASAPAAGNVGPLKTYGELARRWNGGSLQPTFLVSTQPVCTVNILTSLPSTDPVYPACKLPSNTFLWYKGRVETTSYTGAFTTVTAAVPTSNTALQLTDTALASWTPYLGQRWRITSGARQNTMGWVAKDLGANQCRSSASYLPANMNPALSASYPTVLNGTAQNPQIGDTFAIEILTTITLGEIAVPLTGSNGRIVFGELAVRNTMLINQEGLQSLCIYSCSFLAINWQDGLNQNISNCYVSGSFFCVGGSFTLNAGLFSTASAIGLEVYSGCDVGLANGTMFQGVGMRTTNINITDACVFDSAVTAQNPGGHGVSIGKTRNLIGNVNTVSSVSVLTRLWGSGNAGSGVYVDAGSQMLYAAGIVAALTITGTGGDFRLNNKTTANVWDQTANAGAGGWLTPRNCTWANLAASVATTGFGGFANDVESGARVASAA